MVENKKNRPTRAIVYLNPEKSALLKVTPTEAFDRDWHKLVMGVTNGLFHSYILQ